jgi:transcriptional regulator with XRE-family HTH domain
MTEYVRRGGAGRPDSPVDTETWIGKLGYNVKLRRAALGITISELADKSGVISTTRLSMFERGQIDISVSAMIGISKALEIPVSALLPDDKPDDGMVSDMSIEWLSFVFKTLDLDIEESFTKLGVISGKRRKRNNKTSR